MSEANPTDEAAQPPVVQHYTCSQCGALCDSARQRCWMCHADSSYFRSSQQDNPYRTQAMPYEPLMPGLQPLPAAAFSSRYDGLFSALLIGCVVLALLVGLGMALQDPGALVGYAILVGPAFAVTGVRALWQIGETGKTQPGRLLVSLAVSFAVTIAVISLLAFAAIVLLFALCIQQFSNM
jgi:hypothetical protein